MIKFNKQLDKLGTETAFSVSAEARLWEDKGNKVYPFHLGDLNFQTPINIREKTVFYMNGGKTQITKQTLRGCVEMCAFSFSQAVRICVEIPNVCVALTKICASLLKREKSAART